MFRSTMFVTVAASFALAIPAVMPVAASPADAVALAAWAAAPSGSLTPLSAAAARATRATISADLSATRFRASRVGSVKVTYAFSKRSKHFNYVLTLKKGSKWQVVNSRKQTRSYRGSHTSRLKTFFARKAVKVGSYRLKLSADAGSDLLAFTVTGVPPATIKPQPGVWQATGLSGSVTGGGVTVTNVVFTVGSDSATVSRIGFGYTVSRSFCPAPSGFSGMTSDNSTPITNGQFSRVSPTGPWSGPADGFLEGRFDSATTAHGTGTMSASMACPGPPPSNFPMRWSGSTGTFSWTATHQ